MAKLAAWSSEVPSDSSALAREVMEHVAAVLQVPRLLMVWEDPEKPWFHVASWSGGEARWSREPITTFQPLVPPPLAGASFLCVDARASSPRLLYASATGFRRWVGTPVHPEFRARFDVGPVLALNLSGRSSAGYLFCLDKPGMTSGDLVLGEVVAHEVAARIDLFYAWERLKQKAATEERVRLARDLHDGVLQSLTGTGLQLRAARSVLDKKPEEARRRLAKVQRLVTAMQRELRSLVDHRRSVEPDGPAVSSLLARLQGLAGAIEQQWGVAVGWRAPAEDIRLPERLAHDLYLIVQEALVNAARHAHASKVEVDLSLEQDHLRLVVADDGRGFGFRGRYDHEALSRLELGPVSLRERIASLGGLLAIDSTPAGARLEITLTLQPAGEPQWPSGLVLAGTRGVIAAPQAHLGQH